MSVEGVLGDGPYGPVSDEPDIPLDRHLRESGLTQPFRQLQADLAAALARVEKVRALADDLEAGVANCTKDQCLYHSSTRQIAQRIRLILAAPLPSVDGTGDKK